MSRRVDAITWRHIGDEEACSKLRGKARQLAQQAIDLGYKVKRYNLGTAFITIKYQEKFNACQVVIQTGVRKTEDWTPHLVAVLRGGSITPWWFIDLFNFFGGYYDYMELDTVAQRIKDDKDISKLPEIKGTKSQIANPWVTSGSQTWVHPDTGKTISVRYKGNSYADLNSVNDKFCGFGSQVACQPYTDCAIYAGAVHIYQGVEGLGGVHIKDNYVIGYRIKTNNTGFYVIKYAAPYDKNSTPNYPFAWVRSLPEHSKVHISTNTTDLIDNKLGYLKSGSNLVTNRSGDKTIFFIRVANATRSYDKDFVYIINDDSLNGLMSISNYRTVEHIAQIVNPEPDTKTDVYKYYRESTIERNWAGYQYSSGAYYPCEPLQLINNRLGSEKFYNGYGSYNENYHIKYQFIIGVAFNRFTDNIMIATSQADIEYEYTASWITDGLSKAGTKVSQLFYEGNIKEDNRFIPSATKKTLSSIVPYIIEGSGVITNTENLRKDSIEKVTDVVYESYFELPLGGSSYAVNDYKHEYSVEAFAKGGNLKIIDLAQELYEEYEDSFELSSRTIVLSERADTGHVANVSEPGELDGVIKKLKTIKTYSKNIVLYNADSIAAWPVDHKFFYGTPDISIDPSTAWTETIPSPTLYSDTGYNECPCYGAVVDRDQQPCPGLALHFLQWWGDKTGVDDSASASY